MIEVGIVGCGRIAYRHVDALLAAGKYRIKWLYDIKPDMAAEMADYIEKRVGYKPALLTGEDRDIADVISITTPNAFHFSSLQSFWEYGKEFVIEKPVVMNKEEFTQVEKLAKEKPIYVSHQLRYLPIYQYVRDLVGSKKVGMLSHIVVNMWWNRNRDYFMQAAWRGTWKYDGGMLFNQGIHLLDLAIFIAAEDVADVKIKWANRTHDYIEADDVAVGYIELKSGALIAINATISSQPKNLRSEIGIFGEKGTVVINNHQFEHFYVEHTDMPHIDTVPSHYGHMKLYENIAEGRGITISDVKQTMNVLFEIYGR